VARRWLLRGHRPTWQSATRGFSPIPGSMTPAGLAIFGFRQNGVLVTEAAVPASSLMTTGRIYAEVNGPVNTGLAMCKPEWSEQRRSPFTSRMDTGTNSGGGPPRFRRTERLQCSESSSLQWRLFIQRDLHLQFFSSDSAAAFRGFVNERSEFLITTLPLIDLSTPPASARSHFPSSPMVAVGQPGWCW